MIHSEVFHQARALGAREATPGTPSGRSQLRLLFGQARSGWSGEGGLRIDLSLPLLHGPGERFCPLAPGQFEEDANGAWWTDGPGHRWGVAVFPWADEPLEDLARSAYEWVFRRSAGRELHRLWNFVPQINEAPDGLENYRRFCVGRSEAFNAAFGAEAVAHMPAGSAVGTRERALVVLFLAGADPAQHFENPLQIPAYEYPREHGPRPPSFARATLVPNSAARHVFLSGTAAVRGHLSMHVGNLAGQVSTTLEMLRALGDTLGIGADLGRGSALDRQFLVYVRRATDLEAIRAQLEADLLRPGDTVTYVEADICRRELLLEIEGSLLLAQ